MWALLAAMSAMCVAKVFCLPPTPGPELRSTWPDWADPGIECLPYDGSVVPDCTKYIDPINKWPYYHEHSGNCSRFWECGPDFETCLVECAACPCLALPPENCDFQCKNHQGSYQWALTFDEKYHTWPDGPTCVFPIYYDGNCTNRGKPCDQCLEWQKCYNNKCSPQCREDRHCPIDYICDDCGWCVPVSTTTTRNPGCNNDNSKCTDFDTICNIQTNPTHNNCFWCNGDTCERGCASDRNCPTDYPICGHGGAEHRCGCNADIDCTQHNYRCDLSNYQCIAKGCNNDDSKCTGFDEICNIPTHDNCRWCNGDECENGCASDRNCPTDHYPICGHGGAEHRCGCNNDIDCTPTYPTCNNHQCTAISGKIKLKSIKIYSTSCKACSEEGVIITLIGDITCKTNKLDHDHTDDYNSGSTVFNEEQMLGGCFEAGLDAKLTGGNVTWVPGSGTWEPNYKQGICVEWKDLDEFAVSCDLSGTGPVWSLDHCEHSATNHCP